MRMIEKARVVSVGGGRARVAVLPPDDEEKCRRCPALSRAPAEPDASCPAFSRAPAEPDASCPAAAICGDGAGRPRVLEAAAPEGVGVGDVVTIMIEGPSPAWAAFLLLILPLMVAFACGLGGWALTGSAPAGVVGGIMGAAGVYIAIRFAAGRARGRVEIIDANAHAEESEGG